MKTLYIASDIHGGFASIDRLWQIIEQDKVRKRVILLGDTYNHGPRNPFPEDYAPMKVEGLLEERMGKFDIIKGNCDSEVDQMISDFKFKDQIEMGIKKKKFLFVHGHNLDFENLPAGFNFIFGGHTHVSTIKKYRKTIYEN